MELMFLIRSRIIPEDQQDQQEILLRIRNKMAGTKRQAVTTTTTTKENLKKDPANQIMMREVKNIQRNLCLYYRVTL